LKERWRRMRKARETRLKRLHTTFSTDLNQSEFSIYFSTDLNQSEFSIYFSTDLNQSEFSIYFSTAKPISILSEPYPDLSTCHM
jgi:hypothetical protein